MNDSDSENMGGIVFYLFDYIFTELQKNGEITPDKCTKLRQRVLMDSKYSEKSRINYGLKFLRNHGWMSYSVYSFLRRERMEREESHKINESYNSSCL